MLNKKIYLTLKYFLLRTLNLKVINKSAYDIYHPSKINLCYNYLKKFFNNV